MPISFNTDSVSVRKGLLAGNPVKESGILLRKVAYGAIPGAPAASDFADELVKPSDYKEQIAYAHEQKIFPYYHQMNTWCPKGNKWNQNGLNYCWAFGASAAMMDKEAREGSRTSTESSVEVLLAPTSLGFLVNWRNAGNYLSDVIGGVLERGICEVSFRKGEFALGENNFHEGWKENALKHRLTAGGIWDIDYKNVSATIQHCITGLTRGFPVYVAYNWWGHALELVAVQWNESLPNNLEWWLRNSHNENDTIILTGSKAIPDEGYIFRA